MATVVFDFDSTLIRVESLEEILKSKVQGNPALAGEIAGLTEAGMEGRLSFAQSLRQRLALAAPHRDEVCAFGKRAVSLITPGMADLVKELLVGGSQVRIVSGGPVEAILPVAHALGIPARHVHAVRLAWDAAGAFAGIDENDRFSIGKCEGFAPMADALPAPKIAVGDGATDLELFRSGLVDRFIAFTANVRRDVMNEAGVPEASDVGKLRKLLIGILRETGETGILPRPIPKNRGATNHGEPS